MWKLIKYSVFGELWWFVCHYVSLTFRHDHKIRLRAGSIHTPLKTLSEAIENIYFLCLNCARNTYA